MKKNWGAYKKLHKWPGFILSFILLYYSVSGILMNHRDWISGWDVSRKWLPPAYHLTHWNNAAMKGNLIINPDSILVFGTMGVWLTNSSFQQYTSLNQGFAEGMDNRKISDVHRTANGSLYAATLFGLYSFEKGSGIWMKLSSLPGKERFTGLESIGDTVYASDRSFLYKGLADGINTKFSRIELKAPEGYLQKATLFQTAWQLHSGEIFGLPGKIYVDMLGVVTTFLSITGIIYFLFPGWIKRRFHRKKISIKIIRINKWSLKWHNKMGAWTFVLLIVLFFTGMFLRPPLLLTIANTNIAPLKYSSLDQANPWHDKLRDLLYDADYDGFFISTSEGMYFLGRNSRKPLWIRNQPPVSIMGINTFKRQDDGSILIGSFSGLFRWNPSDTVVTDFITGTAYQPSSGGSPIGNFKITGMISDAEGKQYFVDYDKGIFPVKHGKNFPEMPENILSESKMSLWNVSLEFHTGRIFEGLTGSFYILIVPITGIASVVMVFSGYMLYRRKYKRNSKSKLIEIEGKYTLP
jgi:hypothetical protein